MENDFYYAYARGYFDGRAFGVDRCPFEGDLERLSYAEGYETGVIDYSRNDEGKE